jgi:hypothetical protein
MRRALTLSLLALLLAPSAASAEAPPDAVAFAEAAARFEADAKPYGARIHEALEEPPACAVRIHERTPERAHDDLDLLVNAYELRTIGRIIAPALDLYSMRLHAVATQDPALAGGRTAWRRIRRLYAVELRGFRPLCPALRRFVRAGWRATDDVRRARRLAAALGPFDRSMTTRLSAARERLESLGIPHDRAAAFQAPDLGVFAHDEPEAGHTR